MSLNNKKNQPAKGKQKSQARNEDSAGDDVQMLTKAVKKLKVKGKGKAASDDEEEAVAPKARARRSPPLSC